MSYVIINSSHALTVNIFVSSSFMLIILNNHINSNFIHILNQICYVEREYTKIFVRGPHTLKMAFRKNVIFLFLLSLPAISLSSY